jgi:hypothetical protein
MTAVSITWPAANTAFFQPIAIPFAYPVKRVFWINGSSVTSTNMDFGIYACSAGQGVLLYSTGSTVASGTSAVQYTTPSPNFILSPGRYYFALVSSSATSNRGGHGNTASLGTIDLRRWGVLMQASALPLPATMTGVTPTSVASPICGVTRTASGF